MRKKNENIRRNWNFVIVNLCPNNLHEKKFKTNLSHKIWLALETLSMITTLQDHGHEFKKWIYLTNN